MKVKPLMWTCPHSSPPFSQCNISYQGIAGYWLSPTVVIQVSGNLSITIHTPFCTPAEGTANYHFTWGLKYTVFTSSCRHCVVTSCKRYAGDVGSTERMARRQAFRVLSQNLCISSTPESKHSLTLDRKSQRQKGQMSFQVGVFQN